MTSSAESLKTQLGIDTTDFKVGLAAANRELKVLESGFKASVSTLEDWGNTISGVELRQKSLTSQIDLQKTKVAALQAEYERQVAANGEMSIAAQKAEIGLNKETERLGKMQVELKGTDTALDNMRNGLNAAGKSTQELEEQQKSLGQQLKGSWTEINSAIGVAEQTYQLLKGAVNETVGEYVKYADQVRDIVQVTGQQAEEVSRLIQFTDDHKIKTESLNTVMRKMASDGLPLSIDSLAQLSDEYLKLAPGAERQLFLTKEFGKPGADFAETMLLGGAAIRDESAAISGNLILTDAALRKAREYEKAQDDLNDAWMAVKVAMGEAVAPILTHAMNMSTLRRRAEELGVSILDNAAKFTSYADLLVRVAEEEKRLTDAGAKAQAQLELEDGAFFRMNKTLAETTAAAEDYGTQLSNITSFAKQYETGVQNIATAEANLETAEDKLHALQVAGWGESSQKVVDAKQTVEDLRGKLGEAQQAALDATNEMIAGFLQAQLTADGSFTEEDITKVLEYRRSVGLLTEEAYDAAVNALAIANNLAGIPAEVHTDIFIDTYQTTHQSVVDKNPDRTYTGRAAGGPVPAGSFLWNEDPSTRPEVFVASTGGYVLTRQDAMEAMSSLAGAFVPAASRQMAGSGAAGAGAIAGGQSTTHETHLHIGTLIADRRGLEELERTLKGIRMVENARTS